MEKNKEIKFDVTVHYDIKGRKRYKRKLWFVFLILIIVLLGCAAMFYFGGAYWNPDDSGFNPTAEPENLTQLLLIIFGALISLGALVGAFLYYWFDIRKFYKTQMQYQTTSLFKTNKKKALSHDLTKLSKSEIKWYKKLGYITSQEKRELLEKKKKK